MKAILVLSGDANGYVARRTTQPFLQTTRTQTMFMRKIRKMAAKKYL